MNRLDALREGKARMCSVCGWISHTHYLFEVLPGQFICGPTCWQDFGDRIDRTGNLHSRIGRTYAQMSDQ